MVMGDSLSIAYTGSCISVVGIQIKAFADGSDTGHYDIDAES